MNCDFIESQVKNRYKHVKEKRIKNGQKRKSLYEESLSSYFAENYMLSFTGAYVYTLIPIAINAKRLHKKKNKTKEPFEFKLSDCLDECRFLSDDTKVELSKKYLITFEREKESRKFDWGLTRMRNVLLHPEDNFNYFATKQMDYQKYALKMLDLAHKVHEEYKEYIQSPGKTDRKRKEKVAYKKFKKYVSAA
jgi:hypothetical protein